MESKGYDWKTLTKKAKAWEEMLTRFNSQIPNGIKRDLSQLQGCWRRLKLQSKKEYRTSPTCKQEIDPQGEDMLQKGIITESVSPWNSPVVLVKKKDGSFRFCVDLRKVNAVTRKDSFPMPLVSDTLDALRGTKYFSTLDLKSGYWQIEMHPESREKAAFVTHNGLYEFNVMPFGLTNSGASFQRLMGHILRGLEYRFALIYIDDIIIFSKSIDENVTHLEEVFRRLREPNVKLNPNAALY